MAGSLDPRKYFVSEAGIFRVGIELIDENAGIERNPRMTPQEGV